MYSLSQRANFVAIASVIVILLDRFGITVEQDTIVTIIAGLTALVSVIISAWRRYQKGDITPMGKYKDPVA